MNAWDELTLWFLVQCLQGHWGKNSPKNIATFGILNSLYTDLKYIKKIENTECKLFYKHFIWVYF